MSLLTVGSLLCGRPATAGFCWSFAHCQVPTVIRVVGSSGGVPDAAMGQFAVVVRDGSDLPQVGVSVVVQLLCADVQVCANQLDPTMRVDCATNSVQKFTDATGTATFTILGSSPAPVGATSQDATGRIYANGFQIANGGCGADPGVRISALDLDGSGKLGAGDFSSWMEDVVSANGWVWTRSDYDGDGRLGAADLSILLDAFAAGGSLETCASSCP